MKKMIDTFDFIDIWRVQNPATKRFTFRQKNPLVQTRLDYFLVTNGISDMVSCVDIVPSVCSDHSSVTIKLNIILDTPKGRGYWKFNSSYHKDEEFMTSMLQIIQNTTNFNNDINDKRVAWEWVKYEIRKYCIKYGTKKKKQTNIDTGNLLKSLHDLEIKLGNDPDKDVQDEYEIIKSQLKEIELDRSKGAIIRSKVEWLEEGEKPTKYFFSLEKCNFVKKHIRKLKLPDGSTTCNPEEILLLQKSFYETLYTSNQEVNQNEVAYFMQTNVPSLDHDLKRACDGKVSIEECKKVLGMFGNNKSPGNDGLTIEFYRQFWNIISTPLIQCFNYSYDHGELSHSQKQAIISLLEKDGKDRLYIKNWRPISLLNVDYKILTKTLSNRVKLVLPHIININQTGYVEGRKLCYSVRLVQDIMEYTKIKNTSGILLQIDFEKAFDSIEWNFLIKALEKFNFGESFIKWVKVIYTNISSCIINNGICTPYFKVSRSVRQGDPLSGYLFIIALELLAQKIRESPNVQGIFIGNVEYKLTQYVDDLTIFVKDINSAKEIFHILELYHKAAGLKVNKDKTEGLW